MLRAGDGAHDLLALFTQQISHCPGRLFDTRLPGKGCEAIDDVLPHTAGIHLTQQSELQLVRLSYQSDNRPLAGRDRTARRSFVFERRCG